MLFLHSKSYAAEILVEAESFTDKGGWILDQQFMDQMGSPYLNAHGMGVPVKDASTTVLFPETGTYHIYVRTFNWTSPWYNGEGAGKFKLGIAGRKLPAVLGASGNQWEWQYAGSANIKNKETVITLHDLTGFNGRCDAVYFTTEKGKIPPSEIGESASFRKKLLNT